MSMDIWWDINQHLISFCDLHQEWPQILAVNHYYYYLVSRHILFREWSQNRSLYRIWRQKSCIDPQIKSDIFFTDCCRNRCYIYARYLFDSDCIGINHKKAILPAIYTAAKHGELDMCQWLIMKNIIPVYLTNHLMYKMYYKCAKYGHLHIIQWLSTISNYQPRDKYLSQLINICHNRGYNEIAQWLLDKKSD